MVDWYKKPKDYKGTLGIDEFSVMVEFSAGINMKGEEKITMNTIPMDSASSFIEDYLYKQKTDFAKFTLLGVSADGGSFESQHALIYSSGNFFSDSAPATMTPRLECMVCKFIDIGSTESPQAAKSLLRDFQNFQTLRADTPLGTVQMIGARMLETEGLLSGRIEVVAPPAISDLLNWRSDILEFFAHAQSVMSFARGARLQAPVTEWIGDGRVELEVVSQTFEKGSAMAPFSPFNYAGIFRHAVASHFDPGPNGSGLRIAIEWFNMRSGYREGKLIAAMTVLENLVSANLLQKDLELRPKPQFRELRKKILAVVQREIEGWTSDPAERLAEMTAIKDKFEDLNRRSLKQKIDLLAERWGLDLGDIDDKDIAAAKRARDLIVHTGRFEPKTDSKTDLMDHVRLTRELIARFILTALGFEGVYISHMGGAHERHFANGVSKSGAAHESEKIVPIMLPPLKGK